MSLFKVSSIESDPAAFSTPTELTCPLTHELYRDPVLSGSGQIYEREALEEIFRGRGQPICPLTRQPLDRNQKLVTVFAIKSKSQSYAYDAIQFCCKKMTEFSCPDPVKYLRRACEISDESETPIPGVGPEVVSYALAHNNLAVFDSIALERAARSLKAAGAHLDAAGLFFHLYRRAESAPAAPSSSSDQDAGPSMRDWLAHSVRELLERDAGEGATGNLEGEEEGGPSRATVVALNQMVSTGALSWPSAIECAQAVLTEDSDSSNILAPLSPKYAQLLCQMLLQWRWRASDLGPPSLPGPSPSASPLKQQRAAAVTMNNARGNTNASSSSSAPLPPSDALPPPPLIDEEERTSVLLLLLRLRAEAQAREGERVDASLVAIQDEIQRIAQLQQRDRADLDYVARIVGRELGRGEGGASTSTSARNDEEDGSSDPLHRFLRFLRKPVGKILAVSAFGVGTVLRIPVLQAVGFGLHVGSSSSSGAEGREDPGASRRSVDDLRAKMEDLRSNGRR